MTRWNIQPLTYGEVGRAAYPNTPGEPEVLPYWWYDTQVYPAAGIRELTYFAVTNVDSTITNWTNAGSLPDPMSFAIQFVMVDISPVAVPYLSSAVAPAGNLNDVGNILFTARGTLTVRLSQKDYGPWPLTVFHGTGGPIGYINGVSAAAAVEQYANNGIFDGGGFIGGAIIIPPQTDFRVTIRFQQTLVPVAVDKNVRVTMAGTLYRAVK